MAIAASIGIALSSGAATAQTTLPTGLDSPDQGVVCNQQREICYDRNGPAIGITEAFLGDAAAKRLAANLHSSGGDNQRDATFSPANRVECVSGTGPCRLESQPHPALTAVLYRPNPRPAGQTAEMRAIMYGEWDWQNTRKKNDAEVRPKQPERYVLGFEPDGVLRATVDCNSAGGKYKFDGNQITVEITNSTLMSCEPGSLDQVFQENLAAVGTYFMKEGRLFLDLKHNAGTMEFGRPERGGSTGR